MEKKKFYTELAYVLGLAALALGTAFMEGADFGVSMVVAPAYLVYLKLSQALPFFTFGMAEYTLQAVLLVVLMAVLRRFRFSYLFSFVTAVLYGLVLDGAMAAVAGIPHGDLAPRLALYGSGLLLCAAGVSLLFHTYIAPEVYELFVKEVSARYGIDIHAFKTGYDCVSCLAAIFLSFAFFGLWHFEGVKLGTVVCALINGWVIGRCSHFLEKHWEFQDGLKLPIRC
ncbi:MAG TPA: DUF6198 family protein [Pseudoflavonifractor sp.]|jgi:uncharacterized membrane protein YczE|nr:DUF6198 family protein [Pseudoflavonifractor sp.]